MRRVYYPYTEWEDYLNGMYETEINEDRVKESIGLLSHGLLYDAMLLVINEWPISAAQNLTAKGNNKQSWLGQSACCIFHNGNESEVRIAWSRLTEDQRISANKIADLIIRIYEGKNT